MGSYRPSAPNGAAAASAVAGFLDRASIAERAGYIEEMVQEMERLAAGDDLELLRDLLKRAKREARRVSLRGAG